MSIQLKGNDNSSFSDDVTFAGYVSAAGANFATDFNGTADTFVVSASQNGIYQGQISYDTNANLTGYAVDFAGQTPVPVKWKLSRDGSQKWADFATGNGVYVTGPGGSMTIRNEDPFAKAFTVYRDGTSSPGNIQAYIGANGAAFFVGNVTAANVSFNLDTGGTLDVKERLQNTQAILYRLKAALIQPDADVNTLRQRLLEALDILTSDGDES